MVGLTHSSRLVRLLIIIITQKDEERIEIEKKSGLIRHFVGLLTLIYVNISTPPR